MRVVILTSLRTGFASLVLPRLLDTPGVELAGVVFNEGRPASRARRWKRDFRKARRIGILAALTGVRMRRGYTHDVARWVRLEPIDTLARRHAVPFRMTPRIGSEITTRHFQELGPELGLSLGNGYIPERVFTLPACGMVNVHHELLPELRGAASVLWQIYERSTQTGFSVHRIDAGIDTGAVLYREEIAIEFRPSLRETVSYNTARLWRESAERLPEVVTRYRDLVATARPQEIGKSYTTPTIRQFLTILANHRRLRNQARNRTVEAQR